MTRVVTESKSLVYREDKIHHFYAIALNAQVILKEAVQL